MSEYQLIVIGAGPGGYTAALTAAKLGLKTAVVESRDCGGTCLNRGCVPTKALLHASDAYCSALSAARMGVHVDGASVNIAEMYGFKQQTVEKLRGGIESLFKSAKVELIRGRATITAPGTVRVEGENAGEYTAERILIATGSVPARPPIPGLGLEGVVTSDELLEGFEKLPKSIVIIGGGVIGVEFATFFSDLGTEVTIVEGLDRLLPNMDRELGQSLAQVLKKQGVKIFTGAMVEKVEKSGDMLGVCFTQKGSAVKAEGELVLCAIGRRPYTEGLFGGAAPEMDGRRIAVDGNYETSIKGIYAIGDVSSPVQLAHVASAQGTACAEHIAGKKNCVRMDIVPGCVYCKPEIASVGLSEAAAKEAGIPVKTAKCTLFSNARTMIADSGRSFMKLLANADTGAIVGAQLMCEHATDMISQLSEAIANAMTPRALLKAMRPHPTYEEALSDALEELCIKLGI
ncbi:MAG: dihydrolipoyl dehydrogenase [bacterium]|nr:dihydrolipoyl dehydrogenase [bacterium]